MAVLKCWAMLKEKMITFWLRTMTCRLAVYNRTFFSNVEQNHAACTWCSVQGHLIVESRRNSSAPKTEEKYCADAGQEHEENLLLMRYKELVQNERAVIRSVDSGRLLSYISLLQSMNQTSHSLPLQKHRD